MNSSNNILLIGGDGFLGWNLYNKLKDSFHLIIIEKDIFNLKRLNSDNLNTQIYDINKINLNEIIRKNHIDIIINAATDYGRDKQPSYVYENNVLSVLQLIETAINNNVKAFFNTDSFFNKPENYNYTYLKSYIFTKKHLEELLSLYSSKIKIINFKLEHLFGINDNPNKFTNRIIHQLINNERIELTSAEQKRDFIYCKDVAGLYEYAIHNLNLFDKITINVGTGNTISIKDFVLSAHHIIQSRAELLFGALKQREGEIMESHADLSYLKKIGWKPEYNFINALKETIQFEKKRLRII